MVEKINAARPQCPVGLNTLVIPRRGNNLAADKQPYVYLNCGHVQGLHAWGGDGSQDRQCPICLAVSPITILE